MDHYSNGKEHELVNYILGYLIFISTFFITLKIVEVNIITSLVLYVLINIISCIFIANHQKYSIFKFDLIAFNIIFYFFSFQYLLKLLHKLWNGQILILGLTLMYILIFIMLYNFYRLLKSMELGKNLTLMFYISVIFSLIILFACIYINATNITINKFIDTNVNSNYQEFQNNISNFEGNYLSYGIQKKINFINYLDNSVVDAPIIRTHISSNLNPVNKIEDYVLYSASNFMLSSTNGMIIHGKFLKYNIIIQKIIFIYITLLIIVLDKKMSRDN